MSHAISKPAALTPHSAPVLRQSCQRTPQSRRSPRPPSDRDLEIYKRVKIQGHPQCEVAVDHELHYSRVSKIIKSVTRWLAAGGDPLDPVIRDSLARKRLAQGQIKLRLARAIEIASIALEFHVPLTTTRRRVEGVTEVWREETTRDVCRTSPSTLRMLIDAIKTLQQLDRDDAHSDPHLPQTSDSDLLRAVFDFLCACRSRAESDGVLPAAENIPALVASTLCTLVGAQAHEFSRYLPSTAAPIEPATSGPSGQAAVPIGQETGNLPVSPSASLDVSPDTSKPSDSQPENKASALAHSTPTRSVSEVLGPSTQLPPRPSSDILDDSPTSPPQPSPPEP